MRAAVDKLKIFGGAAVRGFAIARYRRAHGMDQSALADVTREGAAAPANVADIARVYADGFRVGWLSAWPPGSPPVPMVNG